MSVTSEGNTERTKRIWASQTQPLGIRTREEMDIAYVLVQVGKSE